MAKRWEHGTYTVVLEKDGEQVNVHDVRIKMQNGGLWVYGDPADDRKRYWMPNRSVITLWTYPNA